MRVLLLSMPDGTHPLYPRFCRPPSLGLASLAGSLREEAEVFVADLILKREDVPAALDEACAAARPDLIGLSCMTFQYETAKKIAQHLRRWNPDVPIALGGYHATIAAEEIARQDPGLFDFLCRGESEDAFRELVRALKAGRTRFGDILGLSWQGGGVFTHNGGRPLAPLADLALPDRKSRLWKGYHIHGLGFDTAETSRGCTCTCNFCSINQMYGRSFRAFPLPRILDDLEAAGALGARQVFFTDDNVTLRPEHVADLCRGILERGLDKRLRFSTQASVSALSRDLGLVELMARAGFNLIFLGIENVSRRNLQAFNKGDSTRVVREVLAELRRNRVMVMGGFILGAPDDDAEDVRAQFRFMEEQALDSYLVQILTPYPKVPLTAELERQGLVVNRDLRRYSGHFANVRTKHLSSRELDYLRWKHFPYLRSLNWLGHAVGVRKHPFRLLREFLARFGERVVEQSRRLLVSEDYAFRKYQEAQLAANLFFGEEPEVRWPDAGRGKEGL